MGAPAVSHLSNAQLIALLGDCVFHAHARAELEARAQLRASMLSQVESAFQPMNALRP